MKKVFLVLLAASLLTACGDEQKSDNEKVEASSEASEAAEAADTSSLIDKGQEKMNEAIDTLQSKGGKLLEKAGDTLKKKIVEPVKEDLKKAGEKIKEAINE
jgi:predicted small secreted protein